jgi:sialidase-1
MKKPNQATLVWRVFTVLALISQSALASITLFSDNFQSYPVQNPAPNPLTNGPAGGQWYFVDPTPPMTVNKHRVLDGVTGAGLDSRYWESMTNNARLTNAITISALPAGSEPYTFRLSFLVASDTGTAGRPVTFKYAVSSSAGTLSFVSGGNLDSSQTLTNLSSYGSASSGTLGKSLDRRFIIVFQGTGLSVGDNIIFDITRVTNSGSALWMTLDDVSLTVDDGTGPQVQSARPMLTLEHVRVTFSEPVEAASATSTTNYSFSGSALSVLNARLIDPATVELQTSSQTPSSSYSLQVSNVGGQTGISMTATQMNFTTPALVVSSVRYDAGTSSDGPSDPTSAVAGYWNFTTNSANPGLTFSAVTNDISTGLNAWKVRDQSASAGTLVYRLPIDSASDALARDNGWRLLVNARMVANFGATSPSSVVRYNRGGWRYGIWFHLTASGDLTAQLLGITTVYTLTALGTGTAAYHTHVLVFDPATGTASYYFDGQPIIKNYAGESDTTEDGLTFGAASSAGQGEINFNRVQFDVVGGTPPVVTLNPQSSTNGVGQKVTFTAGFTPFVGAYQWLSNGVIIAGATNNVYTTGYITLLMDGTQYKCRALHALGNVETTTATLTVTSDTTPPTIANAKGSLLLDRVTIAYSEPVLENYATNIANYVWSLPGVTNISAKLLDPLTVELRTTPQQGGSNYTILVSNVRDTSNLIIPANTPAQFLAPNAPPPERVAVFVNGQNGYACYRIPAMVTTTNGTVIAIADGRISSCGDIPNPLDLVARRSFDSGCTWGPLQLIVAYGSDTSTNDLDTYPHYGITNPIQRVAAGDASLLVDRANGRVWTLYDNGAYVAGMPNNRTIKLEMRYSDDDGTSWSSGIDIEALNPGLRPLTGQFQTGPGNGIQLSGGTNAGRLLFPVYIYQGSNYASVIYSGDHGQTWHLGGNAGTGGGEIQIAETPGGGLLASIRNNGLGTGVRHFNRSPDAGITWGTPYSSTTNQPAIPDPTCQGSILRLTTSSDSNASRLIHANAANSSARVNMTIRISYDEGQTWPVSNQVYSGSSAYSALTKLATGEVGLLFEIDNYTHIDFVRRSVSQMTEGSDSLPPYTVWAGQQFSPAQLANPAISGPDADPDHDGFNNYAEFIAGTDPLDPCSCLKLDLLPGGANLLLLSFGAVSNKTYTVQCRDALDVGPWLRYSDVPVRSTNSLIELPAGVTNHSQFFRLAIPQLP